jgi:SAM-dependent methyltransferase
LLQATSSLNKLNANFKPQLCRSDIANLPFKEGSFDVLCCLEVLEHLFDDEIAVEEIAKVTKSNGRVILSVPFNARSVTQKKNQRVRTLYKSYDFEALRKLFLNKPLRLERAIFWGFPILKIFDLMSLRKIFAVLGSMIRFFENEKFSGCDSLNNHGRCAFLDNLARFYYTRFWRGILLPLVLRLLHFDRIFQDLPLSHDVFLIFRKI